MFNNLRQRWIKIRQKYTNIIDSKGVKNIPSLGATQDEYLRLQSINLAISVEDIN